MGETVEETTTRPQINIPRIGLKRLLQAIKQVDTKLLRSRLHRQLHAEQNQGVLFCEKNPTRLT